MKIKTRLIGSILAIMLGATGAQAQEVAAGAEASGNVPPELIKVPTKDMLHYTVNLMIAEWIQQHPDLVLEAINTHMAAERQKREEEKQKQALVVAQDVYTSDSVPFFGNPEGTKKVIKFMDYRCGYCRRMDKTMAELVAENPDLKVHIVEVPILGPASELASRAALATFLSDGSDAYFKMHRALYQADPNFTMESIEALAKENGIENIAAKMESSELEAAAALHRDMQKKAGVTGTPFFIVGEGKTLPGAVSKDDILAALKEMSQ